MSDDAATVAPGTEKPGYGATPPPPPPTDPLQGAIDEIRTKADDAKEAKVKAEGVSAALDGQLAALLSLKKDSDKAKQAYEAAHEQLTIDQQAFEDYDESAKEELEKQLKDKGIKAVNDLVAAKKKADTDRANAVATARKNLQDAKDAAEAAEQDRKAKADDLAQYKQLATTIGAKHAKLKALRDETTKARQASQPGLAYWLLTRKTGFEAQLEDVGGWLIEPSELPDRLLDAINKLAAAEATKAAADGTVAKRQAELAEAERQNADQTANAEKKLRDDLAKIPAAPAAAAAAAAPAATAPEKPEE
ncbi:hypothetical protein [Modestobacter marinus]|uniref:hypothetical protein n=1 Tax=Modestobacter marinus TaxID=477641 RepID=UPI001C93F287|nr:hypothetical protein [Modestobacter marinus]